MGRYRRKDKKRRETRGYWRPITISVGYQELLNDMVVARALDDRVGAFVILEAVRLLAKKKINVAVYAVTTVQEEIGLRGAITSAYGCDPHAGLAVDVAWATDHPKGEGDRYGETAIGEGPIISRGPNINPVVHKGIRRREEAKIRSSTWRCAGHGHRANAMQLSAAARPRANRHSQPLHAHACGTGLPQGCRERGSSSPNGSCRSRQTRALFRGKRRLLRIYTLEYRLTYFI